ncbi:unnamed protein product [Microthlaspi erraticum]|uniref:Uncharacterized protein n=1 Tax=Microthlaspi erraticum TaxID=1685480 RepID=A0A6D2HFC8_9BRAS|nr:unnamed protein product [Microthlaspi erraticum]
MLGTVVQWWLTYYRLKFGRRNRERKWRNEPSETDEDSIVVAEIISDDSIFDSQSLINNRMRFRRNLSPPESGSGSWRERGEAEEKKTTVEIIRVDPDKTGSHLHARFPLLPQPLLLLTILRLLPNR